MHKEETLRMKPTIYHRKKPGVLRAPGEVFTEKMLHPSGIANVALNC